MTKKLNVYNCFVHIIVFSRIFGLLQLPQPRFLRSYKRLSIVYKNIWAVSAMLFYTFVFSKSVNFKKEDNELTNWLNNAIDYMKAILGIAMLLSMVGMTPFRKVSFIDLLKKMRDIDDELKVLSVTIPYRKLKTKINLYFYSSLFITAVYLMLKIYLDSSDKFFANVAQISALYFHAITELQFVLYVTQIENRLHILNNWLVDYHTSGRFSNDTYWVTPVGAMSSHLSVVSRIHDKLCIAAKKAEDMYAFRMLLIISICFIVMTLKIYYCFSGLYKFREQSVIQSSIVSIVYGMSQILAMVTACSATENEVIFIFDQH